MVSAVTQGTITANGQAVVADVRGAGSAAVQVTGTWTGTLTFKASVDGQNFVTINATPPTGGAAVTSTTGNGVWTIVLGGYSQLEVIATAAMTGSAVATIGTAVAE
jgi:hypothetical protein